MSSFSNLTIDKVKALTRNSIETLERWLRQIIDRELRELYGEKYWEFRDSNNEGILKDKELEKIASKWSTSVDNHSPWIDATTLENLKSLICRKNFYAKCFRKYFRYNYPDHLQGKDLFVFQLKKILDTRNKLSHSNPVSFRQAEQTICYDNDMIDSIKEYYKSENMEKEFNVPSIVRYSDSSGHDEMIFEEDDGLGSMVCPQKSTYFCGDELRMEIEVDSSFNENEYSILWSFSGAERPDLKNKKSVVIKFTEEDIMLNFYVRIKVISKNVWHKYYGYDSELQVVLKVLPS